MGVPVRRALGWTAALLLAFPAPLAAQPPATGLEAAAALEEALVAAIARCEGSVVAIARARNADAGRLTDPAFIPNEFATGVVIDAAGLILTNYHVLGDPRENTYAVWLKRRPYQVSRVRALAGEQHEVLRVRAADPWTDLAILEIDAADLTPIPLGDAESLRKGQIVIALGNPYAIARDGEVSASWGIVSNLARKAPPLPDTNRPDGQKTTLYQYGGLIQTDVRLHLGASGGALINLHGEMVGLTTSLAAQAGYEKSVGYAVPVDDTFRRTLDQLRRGEEVAYGFLGVAPSNLKYDALRGGLRAAESGVEVNDVVLGTPAREVHIRPGDLITHVGDDPIHDVDDLIYHVGRRPAGQTVPVILQRRDGGSRQEIIKMVRLSKKEPPEDRPVVASAPQRRWRGVAVDHATAMPGFQSRSFVGEIDPAGCVAVVDVERNSPAFAAGLRRGVFVSHVENERVRTPEEFFAAVEGLPGKVALRLPGRLGESQLITVPALPPSP